MNVIFDAKEKIMMESIERFVPGEDKAQYKEDIRDAYQLGDRKTRGKKFLELSTHMDPLIRMGVLWQLNDRVAISEMISDSVRNEDWEILMSYWDWLLNTICPMSLWGKKCCPRPWLKVPGVCKFCRPHPASRS